MFNKKKEAVVSQNIATNTILSEGITIKGGDMSGVDDVKIGGVFFGDIYIEGLLIVSDSGNVKGNIRVKDVIIEGVVEGNVTAYNLVHISASGRIRGDVKCLSLVIEEGASFRGTCEMGEAIKAQPQQVIPEEAESEAVPS